MKQYLLLFYFYRVKIHEKYIYRCIQLAKNGIGTTFPNPMVGCVIVHQDRIIGEGFTSPFGGPHAEVNAINSIKDLSLLASATLYVSLEPCSHFGKTPPCADLIVKHKIPNVVVGILDPNEKVSGRGIQKLKDTGCNVVVHVLEEVCRDSHKEFLTYHIKKRPYIIMKWAETKDGFIAPEQEKRDSKPKPYWISNDFSRQLVHQLRSQHQAILVGTNTVLKDNPKLDVRFWNGKSPTRVILDRNLKIGSNFHVMDGSITTIVLTEITNQKKYIEGVNYEVIDFSNEIAKQICDVLYKHHLLSVLIEGGTKTLQTFIDSNLWDEARIIQGNTHFGSGIKNPVLRGTLKLVGKIGNDTFKTIIND